MSFGHARVRESGEGAQLARGERPPALLIEAVRKSMALADYQFFTQYVF
jgi:hypothetical protein